jgi:hypothetical protein
LIFSPFDFEQDTLGTTAWNWPVRDATGGHFLEKTVVASFLFLGFPSWPFNDQEPTIRATDWLEPGQ